MKATLLVQLVFCFIQVFCDKNAKIIIVGSGASGIAAASRLFENGFTDVKILEAQNRMGGRVYTTKIGEYNVDIGGQWVHGDIGNVVFDMASPLGLVQKSNDYGTPDFKNWYSSSGSKLSAESAQKLWDAYVEMTDNVTDIGNLKTGSVGEFLTAGFEKLMKTMPDITPENKQSILFMFNREEMALDGGNDWNEVSAKSLKDYTGIKGDSQVNWKNNGYSTILDILMKKIPDPKKELPVANNTMLNAKVTKINYEKDGPIKVSTADGNEHLADHVIFTGSLGVLKADAEKIFTPALPEKKTNAIKNLGFGAVAKLFLLYDESWWKPENHFIKFMLWNEKDKQEIENDPERKWMGGIYSAISVEHKPKLLCLWLSGEYSREMEKVPEELFKNQTMQIINRFFGNEYKITEPKKIIRTMWNTNENFRGTYSYHSLNTDKFNATNADLAEPIMRNNKPIIQFAGEATESDRYSTVHGAIESGFREAERLMKIYSEEKSTKE